MVSERAFLGCAALLFLGSAALTIAWCGSMSAMPGMEMPGGWTMSMAWMRMPGQTWAAAAGTFVGMWMVMMIAMMLPAVVPALRDYRRANAGKRGDSLTARVAAAYFLVWAVLGAVIFPPGIALAGLAMQVPTVAQAVPTIAGLALWIAGALQLSRWKQRRLACCRPSFARPGRAADTGAAWRHGLRLGLHCCVCCAPLTAMLLVVGVMDPAAMAAATAAISLERLAPGGWRAARLSGILLIGAGALVFARGLG
jgi:predicted metal-binding membrane protein